LLFRVWQRLLEELPKDEVPALVFAGKPGGLSHDLIAQLHNADFLDGKIVLIQDASDADLTALYRGCLFTLFPSLYEGWGLPVTESLSFGKPCLAGNGTSLPEAGGDLARYFDAEDLRDATRVIRATIEDRAGLAAWEAEVRARFRPVPWSASAAALLPMLLSPGDEAAERGASKPAPEHADLVSALAMCPLEPYLA
jgi:glycosyltransferase involved in cell wall biosynthesis